MKKFRTLITGILSLAMCVSVSGVSASASTSTTYLKGDVNGNGTVDLTDLTNLSLFLGGSNSTADDLMSQRLDVDLDGIIDYCDIDAISDIIRYDIPTCLISYTSTNESIPAQSAVSYGKYNASTGTKVGNNYTLSPVSSITDMSPRAIIGNDTREIDYSKSGVVRLNYTKLIDGVAKRYVVTGFVVDEHTILTSAHCLYEAEKEALAYDLSYTLYSSDGTSNGTYGADYYHVPQDYLDLSSYSPESDYALITVSQDLYDYMCFDLGVARDKVRNTNPEIYVTGYSVINNPSRPELFFEMVTGSGFLAESKTSSKCLYYNTDTVGGESGSPVYVMNSDGSMTVIGIHSGSNGAYSNTAKRIDTNIMHFIYNNPNL